MCLLWCDMVLIHACFKCHSNLSYAYATNTQQGRCCGFIRSFGLLSLQVATSDLPLCVDLLNLDDLAFRISFKTDVHSRPRFAAGGLMSMGLELANLEDLPLNIPGIELEHVKMQHSMLWSWVVRRLQNQVRGITALGPGGGGAAAATGAGGRRVADCNHFHRQFHSKYMVCLTLHNIWACMAGLAVASHIRQSCVPTCFMVFFESICLPWRLTRKHLALSSCRW